MKVLGTFLVVLVLGVLSDAKGNHGRRPRHLTSPKPPGGHDVPRPPPLHEMTNMMAPAGPPRQKATTNASAVSTKIAKKSRITTRPRGLNNKATKEEEIIVENMEKQLMDNTHESHVIPMEKEELIHVTPTPLLNNHDKKMAKMASRVKKMKNEKRKQLKKHMAKIEQKQRMKERDEKNLFKYRNNLKVKMGRKNVKKEGGTLVDLMHNKSNKMDNDKRMKKYMMKKYYWKKQQENTNQEKKNKYAPRDSKTKKAKKTKLIH